ncbi:MAG: hypothetical protein JWQ29_1518 [Phenylobacterium sp.]|nr:hypothetical protein [Phenylobacterium sp.]
MASAAPADLPEPDAPAGPARLRLISQAQYANTIASIFGPDIKVASRFPTVPRIKGLLALGQAKTGVTASAVEQFHQNAYAVAVQVTAPERRSYLIGCRPAAETAADPACAGQVLARVGRLLFRRPLTDAELRVTVADADRQAERFGDFYGGLSYALGGLLASPNFLFIVESAEPDPARPGGQRLDAYSFATRLSLLLWNSTPDDRLLRAAERGELYTSAGLQRQLDRMTASPRLDAGVRAFFADMLALDGFAALAKDPVIYPTFDAQAVAAAPEQMLRTISPHLIDQKGDYRDLFTTKTVMLSPALAALYKAPAPTAGWSEHRFADNDPHAGLLTQIGFLSLYAHPGRSSVTKRGRAVRELILCQTIPDPPPNVDFSVIEDPKAQFHTARERLAVHSNDPTCAGCHKLMDPIGLSLETFDGSGAYRTEERGARIDETGELDGVAYSDAQGLGRALRDNPATTSCLVNRLASYAVGREMGRKDRPVLTWLGTRFAADGYRVPDLLRTIALSRAFTRIDPPAPDLKSPPAKAAAASAAVASSGD